MVSATEIAKDLVLNSGGIRLFVPPTGRDRELIVEHAKFFLSEILSHKKEASLSKAHTGTGRLEAANDILEQMPIPELVDFAIDCVGTNRVGTFPLLEQSRIAVLGCSDEVRETLIGNLVKAGFAELAEGHASKADRLLTSDEVETLLVAYLRGAVSSDTTEELLLGIAHKHVGGDAAKDMRERFAKRNEDFANSIL